MMYLSHFGFDQPPFKIVSNPAFFFEGSQRGEVLEALLYAIHHGEGIVKVTGEVGAGKTMLCRMLIEHLPSDIEPIYLANPSLSQLEMLHAVAHELKLPLKKQQTALIVTALQAALIEKYAEGKQVVALIDEAHAMPLETLEAIRLLSNLETDQHKLLQIVLFGQPELEQQLALPRMRPLQERITHHFFLSPLLKADIHRYLMCRMRAAGYRGHAIFTTAAVKLMTKASQGLTRRINILADKALLAAFADNVYEVGVKHMKAAIRDSGFKQTYRVNYQLLGLVAGLLISVGIFYALR